MSDFNSDNAKIDAALKANADAAASTPWVKLVNETLEEETQKWDIDLSGIDLTRYQKLLLYPHLKGNDDQWVYLHINGWTSGYGSPNNATSYCGNIPMNNAAERQNFGVCELTFLLELPHIYVAQLGVTTPPLFSGPDRVSLPAAAGRRHAHRNPELLVRRQRLLLAARVECAVVWGEEVKEKFPRADGAGEFFIAAQRALICRIHN